MNGIFKKVSSLVLAGSLFASSFMFSIPENLIAKADEIAKQEIQKADNSEIITEISTVYDFEIQADATQGINPLADWHTRKGEFAISDASAGMNAGGTGSTALELQGTSDVGQMDIFTSFEDIQVGKKVSVWMYDDGDPNRCVVISLGGGSNGASKANRIYFGMQAGQAQYRVYTGTSSAYTDFNKWMVTKSKGWHEFTIDMTVAGEVAFAVDGQSSGVLKLEEGEFAEFKELALINFWTQASNSPVNKTAYVDNISITSKAPQPQSVSVDDENDFLSFVADERVPDTFSYEYTIDNGTTWTVCPSNKIYVGNKDIAKEDIAVRCIVPEGETKRYPSVSPTVDFTYNLNVYLDMENAEDFDYFGTIVKQRPALTVSEDYSRSGLTSMKLEPVSSGASIGQYEIGQLYGSDKLITNKVVTLWYYDDMRQYENGESFNAMAVVQQQLSPSNKPFSGLLGVNTGVDKNVYVLRENWGPTWTKTSVQRTEGWHSFQWDYTSGETCAIYIDGTKVAESDSPGFNDVTLLDAWSTYSKDRYYDDLSITDTREEVINVPKAPTNSVVNDNENTFAWDFVEGKTDVSLYEYSIDNGKTFKTATANPQVIPEQLLNPGEVMVRLKATDDTVAGAVLRSTEKYSDPDSVTVEKINSLVKFFETTNPDDYTKESYDAYSKAIETAKSVIEADNGGYMEALADLQNAKDKVELYLENVVTYTFEDEDNVPVLPLYGTADWGKTNMSFFTSKAYKINTENVDGKGKAEFKYTFLKPLEDKKIVFYARFLNPSTCMNYLTVGNSETQTGHGYSYDPNQFYYQFYDIKDNQKTNVTEKGARKETELVKFEINSTNENGTQIYMDTILMFNDPNLKSIDYIDIQSIDSNPANVSYVWVDELSIYEKNIVKDIELPSEKIELGYYDNYEINHLNAKYTTEYDYDTTDEFTYTSADSKIAYVTKGGSIQAMSPGETTVTVTASNGATKTIDVVVKDFAVESVNISDNIITQAPNFAEEITMTPDTMKVVNAILSPKGATIRGTSWTSSDESVATVEDGKITALKVGTADITVKTDDGNKTDTIKVNVVAPRSEYAIEIFVAEDGNDMTGTGSIEKPFATIERARDEVRTQSQIVDGGAVVYVREGKYFVNHSISLEMRDSGNAENPVKYSAYKDEQVTITGAVSLSPSDFTLVNDAETVNKLQNSAKGKVYEADISEYLGDTMLQPMVEGYGNNIDWPYGGAYYAHQDGWNATTPYYAVSFAGDSMTLSRWPNVNETPSGSNFAGFAKVNKIPYGGQSARMWNTDQTANAGYIPLEDIDIYDSPVFVLNALTERMKTWNGIKMDGSDIRYDQIWYCGYTGVDYATQSAPIKSIDGEKVTSLFAGHYGGIMKDFLRLYVFNLIQELDIPGEWFIDKDTKKLYMIPPTGSDMNSDEEMISISMLTDTMFTLDGTNNLNIDGIDMTDMLGGTIEMVDTNYTTVSHATITNTSARIGSVGGKATHSGIEYCLVKDVNGGFSVSGGDSNTLEPAYNFVHGCHFDNYQTLTNSFNSAVTMSGVGNIASCNEIENSPNNALMWQGNDNVIEFNEIHHVDRQTTDTSAIYTGRNVVHRGTVIKNNYFHHLGKTASKSSQNSAIYLDDLSCGIEIYDNVFEDLYWCVFVNGGQTNTVIDNEFRNCAYGVVANDWGYLGNQYWLSHGYGTRNPSTYEFYDFWQGEDSPYAKYPYLQTTFVSDDYGDSLYNRVIGNKCLEGTTLFHYMLRAVQPNAKNVIQDWFFDKDNIE